ncbi:hypothetical protein AGMMS49992_06990 [Clostridia bacterium]|nr:hypothetical protein AGMMS49992_06990 [Clostridia bacterium]
MQTTERQPPTSAKTISDENLKRILRFVEEIEHGTVTLIIQDNRVIRVEKTEKVKL